MKKLATLLLAGILLLSGVVVYATGGSSTDPLVSLSYLTSTYSSELSTKVDAQIDSSTDAIYQTVLAELTQSQQSYVNTASGLGTALVDTRVKEEDAITLEIGSSFMLMSGKATVTSCVGDGLIDVTAGTTTGIGSLTAMHRYVVGEDGAATVTITSDTAVIAYTGESTFISSYATDYNALADALKSMGMFKGGDVAYGSGYELERAPTRIEALIMFLRMLGEEDAALAYTGTCPFADAPTWCERYLAYAYDMGYTKGIGTNSAGQMMFGASNTSSAQEYVTFIMRALGYSDSGDSTDFTWDTALSKSMEFGVLTIQEYQMLTGSDFLRAQVVYLSYFTLTTPTKSGVTLLTSLDAKGSVSATLVQSVMDSTGVLRLQ